MEQKKDTTQDENVNINVILNEEKSQEYRFATSIDRELHDEVMEFLSEKGITRVGVIRQLFEKIRNDRAGFLKNFLFAVPSDLAIKSQLTNNYDENRQTDNPAF